MRRIFKKHSTKAERKFYEVLKELHIPFKHRWIINNREIDFIVGKYAIEINGHPQNTEKNVQLAKAGYIPIHFDNKEVYDHDKIKCQLQTFLKEFPHSDFQ